MFFTVKSAHDVTLLKGPFCLVLSWEISCELNLFYNDLRTSVAFDFIGRAFKHSLSNSVNSFVTRDIIGK